MNSSIKFLEQSAVAVAPKLIGYRLCTRQADGQLVGGIITETEAYIEEDTASHSYHGQTARNRIMFGPAGRIYVYFTYGMHWCVNIVTGPNGRGEAVLIRSLLADQGLDIIRQRRGSRPDSELTNGPAKTCQALGITSHDNGSVLNQDRFVLVAPPRDSRLPKVIATPRIGIKSNTDKPWRFTIGR